MMPRLLVFYDGKANPRVNALSTKNVVRRGDEENESNSTLICPTASLIYLSRSDRSCTQHKLANRSACSPPLDEVNKDVNPVSDPQASRAAANDSKAAHEPSSLGDSKALIIVRPSTKDAAQGHYRVTISLWFCLHVVTVDHQHVVAVGRTSDRH